MGSIFGGQSSSRGGGLQGSMQGPGPRNFAGDQAGAFDPMDMYDEMLSGQKDLYSWKQQQDLDMQNKRDFQQNALSTATSETGMTNQMRRNAMRRDDLATQAMAAENAARSGPMPTKMLHGFNIIPGRVADPNAMNAYQRQAFLPSQSSISGGGGPSPAGLTPASASAQAAAVNPQAEMGQGDQMALMMRQYPGMMQRMFPQMYDSGKNKMMNDQQPNPNPAASY